jgi:hypothetical protein
LIVSYAAIPGAISQQHSKNSASVANPIASSGARRSIPMRWVRSYVIAIVRDRTAGSAESSNAARRGGQRGNSVHPARLNRREIEVIGAKDAARRFHRRLRPFACWLQAG